MSGAGVARRSVLSSDRALRGDPAAGRVAIVVGVIFVRALSLIHISEPTRPY